MAIKKSIQAVFFHFYPITGGVELNMLNSYSNLIPLGWDASVFTLKDELRAKQKLSSEEIINGIRIIRRERLAYGYLPFALGIDYQSGGVICLHMFAPNPAYFIAAYSFIQKMLGRKNYKLVLVSYGLFIHNPAFSKGFKFKVLSWLNKTITVPLINSTVDLVHAISETDGRTLIANGIKPSLVKKIENGFTSFDSLPEGKRFVENEFKEKIKTLEKYIVQLARVDRVKNFEVVIRALAKVNDNVRYVIVGPIYDEVYQKELVDLSQKLDVAERLVFLGPVTEAEKFYVLGQAQIFVHLSREESFGIAVLEAMSQGCVCLVSKIGALEELIEDKVNGYSVALEDDAALAKKITEILDPANLNQVEKIKQNNKIKAANRSWQALSHTLEKAYLDIQHE